MLAVRQRISVERKFATTHEKKSFNLFASTHIIIKCQQCEWHRHALTAPIRSRQICSESIVWMKNDRIYDKKIVNRRRKMLNRRGSRMAQSWTLWTRCKPFARFDVPTIERKYKHTDYSCFLFILLTVSMPVFPFV